MILDIPADEDKLRIVKACLDERRNGNYRNILLISIAILVPLYYILYSFYLEIFLNYFYSFVSLLFLIPLMVSLLYGEQFSASLVDVKYIIIIKDGYLQVRTVNLLNIESSFTYPIQYIGGIGLSKKKTTINCGKHKINIESKVIEVLNKRGKKIFEFGFWMHEEDLINIQHELAVNINLLKTQRWEF